MPSVLELLREGSNEELWQKCCGFIHLSREEFMTIQRRLLLEQLELLKRCELGHKIMRGAQPRTLEEFRRRVPLTTYGDYAPYLLERREDVLPEKPILWQHTAGRSGEYPFKWVPVTERVYRELGEIFLAVLIFSSCRGRGDIAFKEHNKVLYGLAPPPYASGSWGRRMEQEGIFDFLPPMAEAEEMPFEERIRRGFRLALSEGLDIFAGMSSILVAVGEQMGQKMGARALLSLLSQPRLLLRLGKALVKSKLARRPLLPRDLWSLKGLISVGIDNSVYREKIKETWGRYPLDVYGCTEGVIMAMQTWDYRTMTFVPHLNLLEFIPEREYYKLTLVSAYQPDTLLLDEVKPGENYAVVITNFRGGPFVRYIIGDIVRITSLRNEELNIDIPQMVFDTRADGLIDIAGFTRLTERTIWQAIENSGLSYEEWVARKEARAKPVLHLYLELKERNGVTEKQATEAVDEQLRKLDGNYADLKNLLGLQPLEITLLPSGTFREYIRKQRENGADLAHLKPPHMNPSDAVLESLCSPDRKG